MELKKENTHASSPEALTNFKSIAQYNAMSVATMAESLAQYDAMSVRWRDTLEISGSTVVLPMYCLLYTSDAADE